MILNGYFGHSSTWLLLLAAWLLLSILSSLAFGVIARVGAWREGHHDAR